MGQIFAPYMNLHPRLQTLSNWNAPVNVKPQVGVGGGGGIPWPFDCISFPMAGE